MKFSDFPQAVIKENVDYAVKEITNVIKNMDLVNLAVKIASRLKSI